MFAFLMLYEIKIYKKIHKERFVFTRLGSGDDSEQRYDSLYIFLIVDHLLFYNEVKFFAFLLGLLSLIHFNYV